LLSRGAKDLCISPGLYGIIIAVQEAGHAADTFVGRSSESLTAALGAGVELGRVSREGPAKD